MLTSAQKIEKKTWKFFFANENDDGYEENVKEKRSV